MKPVVAADPQRRTRRLCAMVALPAQLVLAALPGAGIPLHDGGWWIAAIVFVGFVLSEPMVFHLEARHEAVSFSPSDIPLALGVLLLSPWALLVIRLVAAGAALARWRRPPTFKLVLNLAAFTLETVVTVVVFRALVALGMGLGPWWWVGLIASLLTGLLAGGVTIAAAISLFEGGLASRIRKEFTHSYLFYLPGAVLGASAAVPYLVAPWLMLLFIVPVPLVWLVLRSHGSLMHRFVDLTQIHAFSSQVGRSTHLDDIATTAVEEIAGHLRAGTVALVVWGETGRMVEASVGHRDVLDVLPDRPGDELWSARLMPGEPWVTVDAPADDRVAAMLRGAGIADAVVVALGDEDDLIGVLLLADRLGALGHFDEHDLERLRPLSQQLSVALRKGQLHVQIQHKALHDRLTGLANRAYFDAWAGQHLDTNPNGTAAVLMIDLDRFKEVNDTLGHHAGDQLLVEITYRLRAAVDGRAMVARFGGDEFALFVSETDLDAVCALADVISDALEAPIALEETTVAIAGSIGIAITPDHGTDLVTLLRRADMAMYDAKRRHDRYAVFHSDLEGTDSTRLALLADLRESLTANKIEVYFQPQRDVRSFVICGVEALARWHHPVHGFVAPDVFVTLAEQAGLIGRLTEQVLEKSLRAVRHWLDNGHEIGVAVNISAQSLVSDNFPQLIAAALERARVPSRLLTLEITERAMIGDSPRTVEVLEQLDHLGVRLSVDDFGTGYSSMMNLRHLPISELKIDRSFVTEMLIGGNDEVIVSSTVALGHNLGMSVVAEGVETPEVEARLRSAGCDIAQGYGIARPLPLDQLDAYLLTTRTRPTPERRRQRSGVGTQPAAATAQPVE